MFRKTGYQTTQTTDRKVKSIFCFLIAPPYRGKGIVQRFLERESSPERHRGHVVNDCYPETEESASKKSKATSISYENYVHGIEQRGFDAFLVGGRQIKVDTTDFSKIDMEELFSQIAEWMNDLIQL